jgi:hypothetical protein
VVRSLVATLPGQVGSLLDAPRFAEGKEALLRFASAARAADAALSMSPAEASHLADVLLERWGLVADPVLEPTAAVIAPEEIWIGDRAARVEVTLATHALEEGWEAVWEGSVVEGPPAQSAVLVAEPPEGGARAAATVRARVRARARGGARLLLLAEATVRLRRPFVTVTEDGRRLLVRDQADDPAVGVEVEVGAQRFVTGAGGVVELPKPAAEDALLRVQGVAAGRVRGTAKGGR